MKNKDFDKSKQYCFKKYDGMLTHHWNCNGTPDDEAWVNIENAFLFDIKLYSDLDIHDYELVVEKIKCISKNKFIWFHCSNTPSEMLNPDIIILENNKSIL